MQEVNYAEIAAAWQEATTVVVLTGAGMSTESGLPDFRSQQGLWRSRPETLATLAALRQQPDEFYYFYQWRIARLWEVQPNDGHFVLARLAAANQLQCLVTQNVDGLHQRSGVPQVRELHGTLRSVSCLQCGSCYDSRQLLPAAAGDETARLYRQGLYQHGRECYCPACQAPLRPDVVLFGEALPEPVWQEASRWSQAADLFVVIGSSLTVSPANYLPQVAVNGGAKLLVINQDETPLDAQATWVIRQPAAVVLVRLAEAMQLR